MAPRLLLLLRHAKSAWPEGVADRDRPLAPRGEAACLVMGGHLVARGWRPDRLVASPARRTVETARRVLAVLGGSPVVVEEDERLYGGEAGAVGAVVTETPPAVRCLLAVGHQPELEALAERLLGGAVRLPTAALVAIELAHWQHAAGRLVDLATPKGLNATGGPGQLGVG